MKPIKKSIHDALKKKPHYLGSDITTRIQKQWYKEMYIYMKSKQAIHSHAKH